MKKSRPTIGVDEVGRGCLAGSVFAAAVLEPEETFDWWSEIRDSKKLSAKKRERLADLITENCWFSIEQRTVGNIDKINILQASLQAMQGAVMGVYYRLHRPDNMLILVDGNRPLPEIPEGSEQECIKGGDDIVKCIGAASILAKVARDAYMQAMHAAHPQYDFKNNKGYGTHKHLVALELHGPCPLHRRSFKPVAEWIRNYE